MKAILFSGTQVEGLFSNVILTATRIGFGLMMAMGHGYKKFPPKEKFVMYVDKLGFPLPELFAWGAGASEFLFAIFLALGLMTRLSATMLMVTMAVAAFVVHGADPFAKKEMALLYLAGFAIFLALGSGKFSLDAVIRKR